MSKYSDYTFEQLQRNRGFDKLCQMFLGLATDDLTREKMKSILFDGGYANHSLNSRLSNRDNPDCDLNRRFSLAYLLVTSPEAFDFIVENDIKLFHGTNANALPSILRYGMNSYNKSVDMGIKVNTGEESTRARGRNFISFTDILSIAEGYSTIKPNNGNNLLSYGAIIAIKEEDAVASKTVLVRSDVPEVGIKNSIPKENIRAIMVPRSKFELTKKMSDGVTILPISDEDVNERFYYVSDCGVIHIDDEKYERFKKRLTKPQFELQEVKETVKERRMSRVTRYLDTLKSLFEKEDEYEYGRVR